MNHCSDCWDQGERLPCSWNPRTGTGRDGRWLRARAPLLQTVCVNVHSAQAQRIASGAELVELNTMLSPEMIELTALTKPGPFDKRTHELGTYLGIFREKR
jgi:hypothetical protein